MQVAICDDNVSDRVKVRELLAQKMSKRGESLEITYFDCGEDLVDQYESGTGSYDLIFLDIYMKFMNGMEAARQIRRWDQRVALIFLTASREFAVDGYSVAASGYLIKPIEQEKLEAAVNRFFSERYPRIRQSILVVNGSSGRRIAYDDIMYIESRRMNVRIVCSHGAEHSIRKKLDEVQEALSGCRFLRCNRSYIVNMDYITDADEDFTMENGDRIPIKVREKKQIRKRYFDYIMKN